MQSKSGPIAIGLLIALLICYPISVGPAFMIYRLSGEPEALGSAMDMFYGPLGFLPEWIGNAIEEWGNFCLDLIS